MHFQDEWAQNPVVPKDPPPLAEIARLQEDHSVLGQRKIHEPRALPKKTHQTSENSWAEGVSKPGDTWNHAMPHQGGSEYLGRDLSAAALGHSPGGRHSPVQQINQQSPRVEETPKAEYARQLREQIAADAATAQRKRDDACRPAEIHPTQGLADMPYAGRGQQRGDEVTPGGHGHVVDPKVEYARQLRKQIAADKAAKRTEDNERKAGAAFSVSAPLREEEGSTNPRESKNHTKAGYARQIREQTEMQEIARRADRRRGYSLSPNSGPALLEGATEGREGYRRSLQAEYADQLRAQIEAQKSGAHQSNDGSQAPLLGNELHSYHAKGKLRRQWPGGVGSVKDKSKEEEWHRLHTNQGGHINGAVSYGEGIRDEEGIKNPPRDRANDSLALERCPVVMLNILFLCSQFTWMAIYVLP